MIIMKAAQVKFFQLAVGRRSRLKNRRDFLLLLRNLVSRILLPRILLPRILLPRILLSRILPLISFSPVN